MNPHFERAQSMLATSHEEPLLHREVMATQALVEATLALAYAQDTANLIAYQGNVERSYFGTLSGKRSGQANQLNRTIQERLDLDG